MNARLLMTSVAVHSLVSGLWLDRLSAQRRHIIFQVMLLTSVCLCLIATGCCATRATKPALINAGRLPAFNYTNPKSSNYYLTVYDNAALTEKGRVRNTILNDLMAVIDFNYHEFEVRLHEDKTLKDTSTEIVTLGLTAASTAVGGAEVKTILSAIATGVVGANSSLDKNILQNNTVQALELEMRSLRAQKERDLIVGMADTDAHYPLQSGIRDVIAYYYAGSLTDAMLGLVEKTGSDAAASRMTASEARKALQSSH